MTLKSYQIGRGRRIGDDDLPSETFFRLPPDKRLRIEKAAVREFTDYHYDAASINRIVEAARIAKGSFYQYFSDKKDLYLHLISLLAEQKAQMLKAYLNENAHQEFFDLLHELFAAGLRFASEHPDWQKIISRLMQDHDHPIYLEIMQQNTRAADEFFCPLIEQAMERGECRSDLDVPLTAHLITVLSSATSDYYLQQNHQIGSDYMRYADQMIQLLQSGIGLNSQSETAQEDTAND